jgi:formate-dependent nitrite reductase membrane component NrfD
MARAWLNAWGALLAVGVVVVGILIPLVLHMVRAGPWPSRLGGGRPFGRDLATPIAAALVLVGGFLFRVVIVLSAQGIRA